MAYVKVECSVSRNRKFVKAGPGPSWLWLCGLAYCQEGHTDGFIPHEAIDYLGCRSARNLAKHLVSAGLWDVVEGGWQVHDYLEHNRSAEQIEALKGKQAAGGKLGGRPKKNVPENLPETSKVLVSKTFPVDVVVAASEAVVVAEAVPTRFDLWFDKLKATYPRQRVTSGHLTVTTFIDVLKKAPEGPSAAFDRMMANLETQIAGHEWRVKGYVPKMQNWLMTGAWEQQHDAAAPAGEQLTAKTNRTLQAATELMRGDL